MAEHQAIRAVAQELQQGPENGGGLFVARFRHLVQRIDRLGPVREIGTRLTRPSSRNKASASRITCRLAEKDSISSASPGRTPAGNSSWTTAARSRSRTRWAALNRRLVRGSILA
jgi:hypothetical protein